MTPFKNFTISPGSWVICNEAVCHQYERQISPWDVLHWHHCCQPHPSVPLLKVDCIQEIKQRSSEFSNDAESQKRFSSKVITPTSDVEGEEDRNEMLRPWANGIKAHHLSKKSFQDVKIKQFIQSYKSSCFLRNPTISSLPHFPHCHNGLRFCGFQYLHKSLLTNQIVPLEDCQCNFECIWIWMHVPLHILYKTIWSSGTRTMLEAIPWITIIGSIVRMLRAYLNFVNMLVLLMSTTFLDSSSFTSYKRVLQSRQQIIL